MSYCHFLREMKAVVPRVSPPSCRALATLCLAGLASLACAGEPITDDPSNTPGTTGGSSNGGGGTSNPGGGTDPGGPLENGGPKLRVLTKAEYRRAVEALFGSISAELKLPDDLFTSGFSSVGAGEVAINTPSVELYESTSRAIATEVFADASRWATLVGCQPQADLNDACVVTFIQSFGKRAFRRDLVQEEVDQWLKVGKDTAQLAGAAGPGLAAIVSGILQSPYFLYRIEVSSLDTSIGRLKYDGPSMASRLAFLLTGAPPKEALLAAAASGQLDTAEGVKAAAAALLNEPGAADGMATFFDEFSEARLVSVVEKSKELFPSFSPALQTSMLQATKLFIKDVVLAPGADVRSFFNSRQTFVDATLAPIYGVQAPASGFAQITLGPETGRAGILGQAAVLAGHSLTDHNSPTRRGVFISSRFLCQVPPPPPDGVPTELPKDPNLTERQRLDLHRTNPSCKSCHALFDPLGFALEHFDSIGQYRETEHGLTIDATGTLDGVAFDGLAEMGQVFSENKRVLSCMMTNFYRNANGRVDATADAPLIAQLGETLAAKNYNWREFITDFVASDAFRSAPAARLSAETQ